MLYPWKVLYYAVQHMQSQIFADQISMKCLATDLHYTVKVEIFVFVLSFAYKSCAFKMFRIL